MVGASQIRRIFFSSVWRSQRWDVEPGTCVRNVKHLLVSRPLVPWAGHGVLILERVVAKKWGVLILEYWGEWNFLGESRIVSRSVTKKKLVYILIRVVSRIHKRCVEGWVTQELHPQPESWLCFQMWWEHGVSVKHVYILYYYPEYFLL